MADEVKDPSKVYANPTKRFFVEMLTRDIEVRDAILDLLDNCVDGILRSIEGQEDAPQPYAGFEARIDFNEHEFSIKDNCGGISKDIARYKAFLMGRIDDKRDKDLRTVGMYGIGMKRAIFKLGRSCVVSSYTKDEAFKIEISPDWMTKDDSWELKLEDIETKDKTGTDIYITNFPQHITEFFANGKSIYVELPKVIGQHYSFILNKGFKVYVNGKDIEPDNISILVSPTGDLVENSISPYMYRGIIDEVNVRLIVGFYRPMPDDDEIEDNIVARRSSEDAGWTIVCNDRVVLFNDRTILTGWGDSPVPSFHNQFIGINGIVFFDSTVAEKLPLTTTKRGVDGSSHLYLQVKNFMKEGLKKFTDFTNYWKAFANEEKQYSQNAVAKDVFELAKIEPDKNWKKLKDRDEWKLNLDLRRPIVQDADPLKQIKYFKKQSEILAIQQVHYAGEAVKPSEIGQFCFEYVLDEIKK
ncbi:ATP-binding protein [Dyadobacter pollutisoli]|uniref:ATP-binding protein n=1 Tax=Dyadobacter pollutisoli TaxID=2910158 RepID=A0A9E8N7D6_9BACT|nr:ATP-binding protein [Dyadobacter pollutisoli]WAC11230.1 ATP-binding protein [Dyadobacter pollutisoli]